MKFNIGILIYTHNRVDDAKINMEIIRGLWKGSRLFPDIKIVHSYNGKKTWYPKKTLEDDLVIIKNSWHFQGAADLIDAGIKKFQSKYKIDYLIFLAADTWLIKPRYLYNILQKMKSESFYLSTCAWGLPERNDIEDVGMAIDFFIIDFKWAKQYKMFPVDYKKFYNKYKDLLLYHRGGNVMLEKLLYAKYLMAINRQENIRNISLVARKTAFKRMYLLKDREPVHSHIKDGLWIRKMYWPKMGLLTQHDPRPKKTILKKTITSSRFKNINKLINSNNLEYYNKGVTKMQHSNN